MKKLLALVVGVVILMTASMVSAAGTCTQETPVWTANMITVKFTCTGDASNGAYPATDIDSATMNILRGGYFLYGATFVSGGTAPTTGYTCKLNTESTIDWLGTGGAIASATPKEVMAYPGGQAYAPNPVKSQRLIHTLTENSVNSAVQYTEYIFVR